VSWKGLRHKGVERLTSREWNTVIDCLDELYGYLTSGQQDINVDEVFGRTARFRERIYAEDRPIVLDGDPIHIYSFYDIAKTQIVEAIDTAKVTGTTDLIREYMRRTTEVSESQLPKLDLITKYTGESSDILIKQLPKLDLISDYTGKSSDVLIRLHVDEYGNLGVKIAEPLDIYGHLRSSIIVDNVGLAKEGTLQKIVNALKSVGLDSIVVTTKLQKRVEDGYTFLISHRFEGVQPDSVATIYFENPSESGRTSYIVLVEVIALAQVWVDMYRGVTPSDGVSITPVNLNFTKDITSVVVAKYGVTFTGGTLIYSSVCPAGGKVNVVGGALEVGEVVIVPSGHNILIAITNKSGVTTDLSIRIIWWEE